MKFNVLKFHVLFFSVLFFSACETDNYDKGTGENSLTTADLMMVHANANKAIDYIVTDDNTKLTVDEPVSAKWITTADSIYRAVAYYNKVGDGKAQIVSVGNVPTLVPVDSVENVITDPITFESMWRSRNGAFLNLSIWIKVGNTSVENAHQTIGLLRTEVTKTDDGRTTTHLTLLHSQGDVPEKYSTQYFLSIPCDSIPTDSVHISINTYSGQLEKTIAL